MAQNRTQAMAEFIRRETDAAICAVIAEYPDTAVALRTRREHLKHRLAMNIVGDPYRIMELADIMRKRK